MKGSHIDYQVLHKYYLIYFSQQRCWVSTSWLYRWDNWGPDWWSCLIGSLGHSGKLLLETKTLRLWGSQASVHFAHVSATEIPTSNFFFFFLNNRALPRWNGGKIWPGMCQKPGLHVLRKGPQVTVRCWSLLTSAPDSRLFNFQVNVELEIRQWEYLHQGNW